MSAAKRITVGITAALILTGCGASGTVTTTIKEPTRASVPATTTTAPDPYAAGGSSGPTGSDGKVAELQPRTDADELFGVDRKAEATPPGLDPPPVVPGRPRAVNPNPPLPTATDTPAVVNPTPEVTLIPPVVYPCPEEDPESCAPQPTPAPTVTRAERDVNPTPTFEETTLP